MISTVTRIINQCRLVNIIGRLALLAATDSREYTSLLTRIAERIDYYEENVYFSKLENGEIKP